MIRIAGVYPLPQARDTHTAKPEPAPLPIKKGNPRIVMIQRFPFLSRDHLAFISAGEMNTRKAQAGLLTSGSSYRLRLPGLSASGILQLSSPTTAAGPSPIFTGFPIN